MIQRALPRADNGVMALLDSKPAPADLAPAERVGTPEIDARGVRPLAVAAVALGCGLVFVLIQDALAVHFIQALHRLASRSGRPPVGLRSVGLVQGQTMLEAAAIYAAFAGAGLVLVSVGRRVLFVAPAVAFVAYGVAVAGHSPQPIGTQWSTCVDVCSSWYQNAWLATFVSLVLVLLPAALVARSVVGRRWLDPIDTATMSGLGLALLLAFIAYRTIGVVQGSTDLQASLTVTTFALLAGTAKRWWPWTHVLLALVLSGTVSLMIWDALYPTARGDIAPYAWQQALPLAVIALLASLWQPVARVLRGSTSHPVGLLVTCNILNVGDAVLTAVAVRTGQAVEINPFVRWIGLPAKIVLVGALTWLLYRKHPFGLVWVTAALCAVIAYHLSGIVVNR